MTTTFVIDDDAPILVEFKAQRPQAGAQEVMRGGLPSASEMAANVADQSVKALSTAMNTIHGMARRVTDTIKALPISQRPSQIEVEFGLKLDAQAGAVVAQAGTEASFTVKMTWEPDKPTRPERKRTSR